MNQTRQQCFSILGHPLPVLGMTSLLYKQMPPSPRTKVQAVSQGTVIPGVLSLTVCPCHSNNLWHNEGFAFSLSNYHLFIDMHWEA